MWAALLRPGSPPCGVGPQISFAKHSQYDIAPEVHEDQGVACCVNWTAKAAAAVAESKTPAQVQQVLSLPALEETLLASVREHLVVGAGDGSDPAIVYPAYGFRAAEEHWPTDAAHLNHVLDREPPFFGALTIFADRAAEGDHESVGVEREAADHNRQRRADRCARPWHLDCLFAPAPHEGGP